MLSILAGIKSFVYNVVTGSHVIFYLYPVLRHVIGFVCFSSVQYSENDVTEDEDGVPITITKWNGKTFPAFGKKRIAAVKDVGIRKTDVILCGYPKTGCHWTFEIMRMLVGEEAKLSKYGKGLEGMIDAMPHLLLDSLPSPRVMNSHLLYEELPRGVFHNKNKIVLTIRNPKDTVVSFFHHTNNLRFLYKYVGTFDNYFKMFMNGQLDYGDYFDFYASWDRVMKKENQNENQIFLLEFEELKENPAKKILELAEFLDISISQEFAEEVAQMSSFNNMKQSRGKTTRVFRKGIVGDWKNSLTETQANEVDAAWRQKLADFKLPSQKDPVS